MYPVNCGYTDCTSSDDGRTVREGGGARRRRAAMHSRAIMSSRHKFFTQVTDRLFEKSMADILAVECHARAGGFSSHFSSFFFVVVGEG